MVKIRIPIREQLVCLVFLATGISLTVIALAIWYTNHKFVLDLRSDALMLTASLKSAQLSSSLLLMQILVKQATMRLVPQTALELYYQEGNSTDEQWDRTAEDYDAIFAGDENSRIAVQARIYHKEGSHRVLFSRTASRVTNVTLPYERPDGRPALMGDYLYGYIPELYPRFEVHAIDRNLDRYDAEYQGRVINRTNFLLLGPYQVSNHLALISITMPIVNDVSDTRTIGWLTIALDAELIKDVIDAKEGLGDSGLALLFGPYNVTNTFPTGYLFNSPNANAPPNVEVRYQIPPTDRADNRRHIQYGTSLKPPPLDWAQFPAVRNCFTRATNHRHNAGNMMSTRNEEHRRVAVGYAIVDSSMVDWMVMVEYLQPEIWKPIDRLRSIILACVFGTMLAMLLLTFPVAHYFVQPIRRLQDATGKTMLHQSFERTTLSNQGESEDQTLQDVLGHIIGSFCQMFDYQKNYATYRAEKQRGVIREELFRIPDEVKDRKHFIHDELTDLTTAFNTMINELMRQYETLDEKVRQRTAELELSKNAAEAANESKTLFIANISHELKTPLNGILGMCAVCMFENDPIKLKQSLSIINKSGDLLLKLLTDLLTFSKNQIGQQLRLDEKKFSLRDIRSQILAIFEQQAKECKIKLLVRLEEASNANLNGDEQTKGWNDSRPSNFGRLEDMVLWGDEHRIARVLLNLVSNSLKFTPEGGSVTITIRCTGEINSSEGEKGSTKSRYSPFLNPNMSTAASADEIGLVSKVSQHCATSDVVNDRTPISLEQHPIVHHRSLTLPPGHWLSFEFEVKDTGLGIPEQLQSKIFEPFVQGDLSLNKKYGGTGLGLSICSQLVGLMEGTLTLKSQVGFGSTFIMSIPLKHITSHADSLGNSSVDLATTTLPARSRSIDKTGIPQSTGDTRSMPTMQSTPRAIERIDGAPKTTHALVTSGNLLDSRSAGLSQHSIALASSSERSSSKAIALKRAEARGAKRRSTTKVLVAEDNKTNQEVMVRMLALEDVQNVTVVTDGREALDRVKETMRRQDPYDIIFMDIQMPNVDGLQSTRLIRQLGFMAPIVALTAYTEEKNVHDCLNSGMDFFLSKPIRRPALKHVLETYYPTINSKDDESTSTTNPLKISEST